MILAVAIQIPYIQTKIVSYLSASISKNTGFPTSIKYVGIDWFDRATLRGITIYDPEGHLMLSVDRVSLDFYFASFWNADEQNIDELILENPLVNFRLIQESDSSYMLNIKKFIQMIQGPTDEVRKRRRISVDYAVISDGIFGINTTATDSLPAKFDHRNFRFEQLEMELTDILLHDQDISMNIDYLSGIDATKSLTLDQMSAFFSSTENELQFHQLDLHAGKTRINDHLTFRFENTASFNNFIEEVEIEAHFANTVLHSDQLALFVPQFEKYHQAIEISGYFTGYVNNFNFDSLDLKIGNYSQIKGALSMSGLPDIKNTFLDLRIVDSRVDVKDFRIFIPQETYQNVAQFERFLFSGWMLGFTNDFVANGDFRTIFGRMISDLNLKIPEEEELPIAYSGGLKLENFNLGKFFNDTATFQQVNLDGRIKGTGITLEKADFRLDGSIKSIGILGYNYKKIVTNARFTKELFNGKLVIDDPNLKFQLNGNLDIRNINKMTFVARLDTAIMHHLGFMDKEFGVRALLEIDAEGNHFDNATGTAAIRNASFYYEGNELEIDSIFIDSEKSDLRRAVNIRSNLANATASGQFDFTTLAEELNQLYEEYQMNLRNDTEEIDRYYSAKANTEKSEYQVDFQVTFNDINPVFDLLNLDLHLTPGSILSGNYLAGYTSIFSAYSLVDSISYNGNVFLNNEIELNASKRADDPDVLAMALFGSENAYLMAGLNLEHILLDAVWNKTHLDFHLNFDQQGENNYARLGGRLDFRENFIEVSMLPSEIKLLEQIWSFEEENYLYFRPRNIQFDNLTLKSNGNKISLNGTLTEELGVPLNLEIENFDLININPLINKKLGGRLDGVLSLSNYYTSVKIENDLVITDLSVDEFSVGDIKGTSAWNEEKRLFELDFFIENNSLKTVKAEGTFQPANKDKALDLNLSFDDANLDIIEPFVTGIFSEINGKANGQFKITGSLDNIKVSGTGRLNNGEMLVNYLKTKYSFNGNFNFSENQINLRNIRVADRFGNLAILGGYVAHNNFKDFRLNLMGDLDQFEVLNTTLSDNDLFYGSGFASGSISFEGPINNLTISADVTTRRNTRLFIPLGGSSGDFQQDFIRFTNLGDTTAQYLESLREAEVKLTGLKIDLNLGITEEAYCEIIFDQRSGDIIRGRGVGGIRLQINTEGEFNMFGDYEIRQGGYNFTLYNIINKEFNIQPGGRISWFGDPYHGEINLKANYDQMVSLAPILDTAYQAAPEVRRRYPTRVIMDLKGALMSPEVSFDIEVDNLPNSIPGPQGETIYLQSEFDSFRQIATTEELKRQVFSLIVLRRFSPVGAFNTGGAVGSSVSEFFSNQLSYWVSQVDENLEIDVDISTMSQEAYNTFQLRLSYTFLDGRLRVTRDGGFTDMNNEANVASLAGDWTVEYLLTPEGKFRAKMYNRTNFNRINANLGGEQAITTGFSLMHTQSFNDLKDLFSNARRKREAEKAKKDLEDDSQEENEPITQAIKPKEATLPDNEGPED